MTGAKLSDEILAGAFAGIIARSISAPFDVLKIRSQIETTAVGAKPISILNSFKNIIANEGFFALWKGNLSATYLWITYAMVQFTVYSTLKKVGESFLQSYSPSIDSKDKNGIKSEVSWYQSKVAKAIVLFLAGSCAGIASTAATYPFDIMRTQFTIQGKNQVFPSMQSFISHTFKTKGITGFYVGMTPALVGITPYMGLNFAIYELMKGVLKIDQPPPSIPSQPITSKKNKSAVDRILSKQPSSSSPIDKFLNQYQSEIASIKKIGQKFLCGGLAGGVSKLAVYPLDTIKKRLQTQGLRSSLSTVGTVGTTSMNVLTIHYNGIVDCFQKVIRTEGFKGLYKGIVPTVMKSVVATSVTFVAYEAARDLLQLRRKEAAERK